MLILFYSYLRYGLLAARVEILKVTNTSGNPCVMSGYRGNMKALVFVMTVLMLTEFSFKPLTSHTAAFTFLGSLPVLYYMCYNLHISLSIRKRGKQNERTYTSQKSVAYVLH